MECESCGYDIPDRPGEAVEEDLIDEVVIRVRDPSDSIAVAEQLYYCDLDCAAEAAGGEE